MSVCAKVLNTSKPNMALNLIPRQVRSQRKCPDVVDTLRVTSPGPGSLQPPPAAPSHPEPAQTQEVVPVNLGEAELQPRPYQVGSVLSPHRIHISSLFFKVELLEKAKMKNIIVYLGTGSGKTFIAVMLIKHLRDEVALKKKVVFLANNVALLEQQAEVISKMTGLKTGSYCGAHGVDDWGRHKWEQEWSDNQVLVFIHQVFLNTLARGYFKMSDLALIIIDECHHAVKVSQLSHLSPLININYVYDLESPVQRDHEDVVSPS